MSPGTDLVLVVVRISVNKHFSTLMPTLYPGLDATGPRRYASLNAMWQGFSDIARI